MAALDVAAEVVAALRSPEGRAALTEALRPVVAEELARATKAPALEPLATILGCSLPAARMRELRDPELRALAVQSGRRRLYRRDQVLQLLEVRFRAPPRLRSVGGGG